MNVLGLAMRWWRGRQRHIDVQQLWPQLLEQAKGRRDLAKSAFKLHMAVDPAYSDMSESDKFLFLEELP
jgi:hypothetical protein